MSIHENILAESKWYRNLPRIALSIQQPWAWLIAHGFKDIENRTWRTFVREPFLIHAGKTIDYTAGKFIQELTRDWIKIDFPHRYDTGGFVGIATIAGCVETSNSRWFTGPYGLKIVKAEPIKFIPWKGQLGLFKVVL